MHKKTPSCAFVIPISVQEDTLGFKPNPVHVNLFFPQSFSCLPTLNYWRTHTEGIVFISLLPLSKKRFPGVCQLILKVCSFCSKEGIRGDRTQREGGKLSLIGVYKNLPKSVFVFFDREKRI